MVRNRAFKGRNLSMEGTKILWVGLFFLTTKTLDSQGLKLGLCEFFKVLVWALASLPEEDLPRLKKGADPKKSHPDVEAQPSQLYHG